MKKFIIGLGFFMLFISCQEPTKNVANTSDYNESGLNCKITSPAGDLYAPFQHLTIPPFFNIGEFRLANDHKVDVVVLSERLKKGRKIDVDPVALFSFKADSTIQKFVVVIPHDNGQNNLKKEYDEFLTINIELKMALENWFKAQCPINKCQGFAWQNSYKALLELE